MAVPKPNCKDVSPKWRATVVIKCKRLAHNSLNSSMLCQTELRYLLLAYTYLGLRLLLEQNMLRSGRNMQPLHEGQISRSRHTPFLYTKQSDAIDMV